MSKNNNKKTENSSKSILITIVAVFLALVCIGLALVGALAGKGVVLRNQTAVKSENYKVSGTEMAYFAGSAFQQYYQILGYFGADAQTSLKDQECSLLGEGKTWFDYFIDQTKPQTTEMLALCEYAKANGIKLDKEDKETIEANIAALGEAGKQYNLSADEYVKAIFHNGVNLKDIRNCYELYTLSSKAYSVFAESVKPDLEAEEAYYAEHPEDFDGVDYYTYVVSIPTSEEGEGSEESDNATTSAVMFALSLENVKSVDEFKSKVREYEAALNPEADDETLDEKVEDTFRSHVVRSSVTSEEIADWLFSAKAGDSKLFTPDEENSAYTMFILDKTAYRDETKNRAVRHILIEADDESEEDEALAQQILDELKAADFSEEKWNELAAEHSVDGGSSANGGLYGDIVAGQTYAEFDAWLFDEDRKAGDSDIVDTEEGGHHVMYYVGESESTAWMIEAESAIVNEKSAEMIEEYSGSVEYIDKVIGKINLN